MTASAQPFTLKLDPEEQEVVALLAANLDNLYHPMGWVKHPYFQHRFSGNPEGVRQVTKVFAEAVVLLLSKHDKLKKPPAKKAARKAPAKRTGTVQR